MSQLELGTEDRIKQAAERIFQLHGLEGARMQDIADEAKINKAMLHYYFRSKEILFHMILDEKIAKVFHAFTLWFDETKTLEQKLRSFIGEEIDIVSKFPMLPLFVLTEARKNPELIKEKFTNIPIDQMRKKFKAMIKSEHLKGHIKDVSMEELLINTMSLCIYPIIAAPMLQHVLDVSDKKYVEMIDARKKGIGDMMVELYSISTE